MGRRVRLWALQRAVHVDGARADHDGRELRRDRDVDSILRDCAALAARRMIAHSRWCSSGTM
jgi:hypothetical protein